MGGITDASGLQNCHTVWDHTAPKCILAHVSGDHPAIIHAYTLADIAHIVQCWERICC